MGDCLLAGKLSHYVMYPSTQANLAFHPSGVSYSWEGKGRYGSCRLRIERVGMQVKL